MEFRLDVSPRSRDPVTPMSDTSGVPGSAQNGVAHNSDAQIGGAQNDDAQNGNVQNGAASSGRANGSAPPTGPPQGRQLGPGSGDGGPWSEFLALLAARGAWLLALLLALLAAGIAAHVTAVVFAGEWWMAACAAVLVGVIFVPVNLLLVLNVVTPHTWGKNAARILIAAVLGVMVGFVLAGDLALWFFAGDVQRERDEVRITAVGKAAGLPEVLADEKRLQESLGTMPPAHHPR
jgi:hypothetical protein